MRSPKRQRLSMRITVVALALLLASAGLFLYAAVTVPDATSVIPAILIGAVMFLAWRAPGKAGILLLLFSPIGFFLAALADVDPQSQVIEVVVWFAGVPLVSGVLLVIADFVLPVAGNEEHGADVKREAATH